jgi:CO/xanthine dehydrogenase FAD-binding subunit
MGSGVLAGGTDLLIELRQNEGPSQVVDITGINELRYIRREGDYLLIGALTTHSMLAQSDLVRQYGGPLSRAAAVVGAPQIRNRGTIGGNVANAAVCADTVPALVALDAIVRLESTAGVRELLVAEFITGPNRTVREPGELITQFRFKLLPAGGSWGFQRLARREALAVARMNVAVVMVRDKAGVVTHLSIAPGSVLPSPARISEAEGVLVGQMPTDKLLREAGEAVAAKMVAEAGRRWSTPYKEPVIISLVERALKQALGVEWE